jgi:peptide/nickel transport system permease protein
MSQATISVPAASQSQSSSAVAWRRFKKHRLAMISAVVLGLLILVSIFAPWIAPYAPGEINAASLYAPASSQHWMGTDGLGRDVFSRVLHAGRVSLLVGILVALLSAIIGVVMGLLAGYFSGQPLHLAVGPGSSLWSETRRAEGSGFVWRTVLRYAIWTVIVFFMVQTTAQFASTFSGIGSVITWVIGGGLALATAYFAFYKSISIDVDTIISRLIDVMLSLPQIPFLLILSGLLANPEVPLGGVLDRTFGDSRSIDPVRVARHGSSHSRFGVIPASTRIHRCRQSHRLERLARHAAAFTTKRHRTDHCAIYARCGQ